MLQSWPEFVQWFSVDISLALKQLGLDVKCYKVLYKTVKIFLFSTI